MDYTEELYTIGQISSMCNISIQTLRYYNEIGLLLPEIVDAENGYRYYTKKQVLILSIIKHFKTSGFSLEDIQCLIKRENLSILLEKLEGKLQETKDKLRELRFLESKLEMDIKNLRQGKEFSEFLDHEGELWDKNGIEIKLVPSAPILFTRYRCASNPGSYIKRYSELGALMEKYKLHRVGPLMAIFHDDYTKFDYNNADIEVCMPVAGNLSDCPSIREYGGFWGVTMLHRGEYSRMPESYAIALEWIEKNGYEYLGSAAERYIIDATSTGIEENYVTEILLPVRKK